MIAARLLRRVPAALAALTVPAQLAAATQAGCADSLLQSFRSRHGIPALVVAVARGDTLLYNVADGAAHVELNVTASPSTIFQLSSTAKLLPGTLAMQLVEEGALELDAPVTRYLPDAPPGWERLTMRHLLSHTDGLPGLELIAGAIEGEAAPAAILRQLYRLEPDPLPGERFEYGLAGYLVAQQILERVGGAPFSHLVERRIFAPAGLTGARYWRSSGDVVPGAASGYYPDSTGQRTVLTRRQFVFPEYLFAAGGFAASAEDLVRFARAFAGGKLIGQESTAALWADTRFESGESVSYGLGWDTKTHASGHRSAGHSGGYLTTLRIYPSAGLAVIVLANGFLEPLNPDDLATAFAAVWEPELVGFSTPACTVVELEEAEL